MNKNMSENIAKLILTSYSIKIFHLYVNSGERPKLNFFLYINSVDVKKRRYLQKIKNISFDNITTTYFTLCFV